MWLSCSLYSKIGCCVAELFIIQQDRLLDCCVAELFVVQQDKLLHGSVVCCSAR